MRKPRSAHATLLALTLQPTSGRKRKNATTQAEQLYDAREQIKAIVAAPDPQAFVVQGLSAAETTPTSTASEPAKP